MPSIPFQSNPFPLSSDGCGMLSSGGWLLATFSTRLPTYAPSIPRLMWATFAIDPISGTVTCRVRTLAHGPPFAMAMRIKSLGELPLRSIITSYTLISTSAFDTPRSTSHRMRPLASSKNTSLEILSRCSLPSTIHRQYLSTEGSPGIRMVSTVARPSLPYRSTVMNFDRVRAAFIAIRLSEIPADFPISSFFLLSCLISPNGTCFLLLARK